MKITVVGCGAMGAIFVGLLAGASNEVSVLVRNRRQMELINQQGLRVEGPLGDHTHAIRATNEPTAETPPELLILAVKATQIEAAAQSASALAGDNTLVLTIQNGLGSADAVARILGDRNLIVGIAGGFGAQLVNPRHTFHNNMQIVRMGAYSALARDRIEEVVSVWSRAGFRAEASDNIHVMLWEKLICNVAYSAPCAITGMTTGQVMDDPDMGPISRAAAMEAWEVARAQGIDLRVQDPVAHVRAFSAGMPKSRPSLLQDVEAGRPSEIDFINGAIPREAEKAGIEAPVNAILAGLVRSIERATIAAREES